MSQNYTDRLYGEYSSQREAMHDASLEAAGRYDRTVLAITTGAMGLSLTFIEKVTKELDERTIWLLMAAWMLLLLALICELLALSSSQKACQRQVEILDEEYERYLYSEDPGAAVANRTPTSENNYSKRTHRYSSVALWSLIAGIILMMAFSASNLYINGGRHDGEEGPDQEEHEHGGQKSQGQLHPGEKQATTPSAPQKEEIGSNQFGTANSGSANAPPE